MLCHLCENKYSVKLGYLICANKKCAMYNKKQTRVFKKSEEE